MSSYELTFSPVRLNRSPMTGRFLKGCKTHNKGKTWDEYMSKEGQDAAKRGWENLNTYRDKAIANRSSQCGRKPTPLIAILKDKPHYFPSMESAARWIEGRPTNVHRCACDNRERRRNKKNGKVNTDHSYKGVRFYFENDDIWTEKIRQ